MHLRLNLRNGKKKRNKSLTLRTLLTVLIILTGFQLLLGQKKEPLSTYCFPNFQEIDSADVLNYAFIDPSVNHFRFYCENSTNWELLAQRMDSLIQFKQGKMHFYHIGGSHLQADIYTHDIRTFLQSNWEGIPGERGMVFPFKLAHTNNPSNYEFTSPNTWTAFRSVTTNPSTLDYGVMGAAITCNDSVINLYFRHNRSSVQPPFTTVRILHNKGELPFDINFGGDEILVESIVQNPNLGYSEITFSDPIDVLDVQFSRKNQLSLELEIYGFQFLNELPGISYTSIGVNGAGLYTYLGCKNFEEQLAIYPPDFFAFSVGTNDGNVPYDQFDPQVYKRNLEKMIQKVLRVNPNCAILLTVPNDSYYHQRYLNRNIAREREMIIELAETYRAAVWDFYGIMGELGSSKLWKNSGLMQSDLVHFTTNGYHLKGELFTDSFLKFLRQMHERTIQTTLN